MTGDPLLDLAIAFIGTVVLVGLSLALGALRSVAVDQTAAAERLAFDEPDFRPADWLVSDTKRAAVASDAEGKEYAVVFAVGDGLATRRMPAGSKRVAREGRSVTVFLNEPSKRRVPIIAGDEKAAEAWAGRLSKPALS